VYIIDKNKDYYDYLSHIYGVDKKVTYDRRGSKSIKDEDIVNLLYVIKYPYHSYFDSREYFIVMEVGDTQYLIKVFDIKYKEKELCDKFISCSMKLMWVFKNHTHYFDTPMSIHGVKVKYQWKWKNRKSYTHYIINDNFNDVITNILDKSINNPILSDTQITSLIGGDDIWQDLQNYISSLNNDSDITIPMTDVEKIEVHGFDKKTSFRHPVK